MPCKTKICIKAQYSLTFNRCPISRNNYCWYCFHFVFQGSCSAPKRCLVSCMDSHRVGTLSASNKPLKLEQVIYPSWPQFLHLWNERVGFGLWQRSKCMILNQSTKELKNASFLSVILFWSHWAILTDFLTTHIYNVYNAGSSGVVKGNP